MSVSGAFNAEELHVHIINELKTIGVKHRKDKKSKLVEDKTNFRRRIFRTPLHLLELSDVILANGSVVQIPKLVADACNRILEHVETEGIFRKAGSSRRQKEIRVMLESGRPLGKSHHVIDIANVVKYFFRELPEPLIPTTLQDTLLHALLIGEQQSKAILLACLLLPSIAMNTLRFFMQFLHTVSLYETANKMSTENLAIILTPGLMPLVDINSHRFTNHIKVVKILIENANDIGTIPQNIVAKLRTDPTQNLLDQNSGLLPSVKSSLELRRFDTNAKKKSRRSGSLTHMFNGFKKIVGSTLVSSDELEETSSQNMKLAIEPRNYVMDNITRTPTAKLNKRKFTEQTNSNTCIAKKKRDLLALLPTNGGFLPNTPLTKESRNHRPSLRGNNKINSLPLSMERRWSIVGTGWSKHKNKHEKGNPNCRTDDGVLDCYLETKNCDNFINKREIKYTPTSLKQPCLKNRNVENTRTKQTEIVDNTEKKLPKNEQEYTEEKLTGDFKNPHMSPKLSVHLTNVHENSKNLSNALDGVQTQYDRILKDTASLSLSKSENFSPHLDNELINRCRLQEPRIRSTSARKIGNMRRRPKDKSCLPHTENSTAASGTEAHFKTPRSASFVNRNRPGLARNFAPEKQLEIETTDKANFSTEEWMTGEQFFRNVSSTNDIIDDKNELPIVKHVDHVLAPINDADTSMSLPETPIRNIPYRALKGATTSKKTYVNRISASRAIADDVCTRDSISRLKTLNAGMVMAKAKLFDSLGSNSSEIPYELGNRTDRSANTPDENITSKPLPGVIFKPQCKPVKPANKLCQRRSLAFEKPHHAIFNSKYGNSTTRNNF